MAATKPIVAVLGTCDTKLAEILFVRDAVEASGEVQASVIDIGSGEMTDPAIEIGSNALLPLAMLTAPDVALLPRSEFVEAITVATSIYIRKQFAAGRVHGLIAVGGSTGTSIAAAVARDGLPAGCPKLLVSTMASGDVSSYVGCVDITLMYSVVDIAGLNFLSKQVLENGGAAIAGMAKAYHARYLKATAERKRSDQPQRKRIGMTMFGVTTPACDRIRDVLTKQHGCEVVVFHATGAGGRAFERLIGEGEFDAVVDLTTTEIADHVVGGVLSAGPERLRAAAKAGIPQVISLGACDMVNFGPPDTVPPEWRNRLLLMHNPAVTLMRTTDDECQEISKYMANTLIDHAANKDRIRVLFPLKGLSMISTEGQPFHDQEADEVFLETLQSRLENTCIELREVDYAINDEGFANAVVSTLVAMMPADS